MYIYIYISYKSYIYMLYISEQNQNAQNSGNRETELSD